MSMTASASTPPRPSADLRAELAQVDLDMLEMDGRLSSEAAKIRLHALSARRGDAGAVKAIADCHARKLSIASEIDFTGAAKVALAAELREAVAREEAQARQVISDEAQRFAAEVAPIGAAIDQALATFVEVFIDLKSQLHLAEARGYGPSGLVVQSALTQSLRSALWRITELGIPSPHEGLGRSFASLTSSWSGAAGGASARLLQPPGSVPASPAKPNGASVPPKANAGNSGIEDAKPLPGPNQQLVQHPDGHWVLIPKQTDISERLPGDPRGFQVRAR
jgi:hypothetical protein